MNCELKQLQHRVLPIVLGKLPVKESEERNITRVTEGISVTGMFYSLRCET